MLATKSHLPRVRRYDLEVNAEMLAFHADVLWGSSRVPAPQAYAEASGQIPFPLFANITWNSSADYRRTNRRFLSQSVDKPNTTYKLGRVHV